MVIKNNGSTWHKWDLHIHTPETKRNDNFNGEENIEKRWQKFCKMLNKNNIEGIGITDYFAIDNYEKLIKNRDKWGLDPKILILPNIELRVSDIRSKRIMNYEEKTENQDIEKKSRNYNSFANIHIIFSDKVKIENIKRFLSKLPTKKDGLNLDFGDPNKINWHQIDHYPTVEEINNALKESNINRHDYLIMDGAGEDGIGIDPDKNGYDDCLTYFLNNVDLKQIQNGESSKKSDINFYQKTLPNWCKNNRGKKFICPCVIASDAHKWEEIGKKYTYIKSDLSFEGLRQIKFEPKEKERILYTQPLIRNNSQIIDTIQYGKNKVYFNPGLNTIIGGRSTGKSTLINTIYKYQDNILDINSKKDDPYYLYKNNENSDIKIIWKDGSIDKKKKVIFIPQDYMIKIADAGKPDDFNRLVKKLLNMRDDIDKSKEEKFKDKVNNLKIEINDLVNKIVSLYNQKNELPSPTIDEESVTKDICEFNNLIDKVNLENNNDSNIDMAIKFVNDQKYKISEHSESISKFKTDLKIIQSNTSDIFSKTFNENINNINCQLSDFIKEEYIGNISQISRKFIEEFDKNNKKYIQIIQNKIEYEENLINNLKNDSTYKKCEEIINKNEYLKNLITKKNESKNKLIEIKKYKDKLNKINNNLNITFTKLIKTFYEMLNLINDSIEIYSSNFNIYLKYSGIHFEDIIDYYNKRKNSNNDIVNQFNDEIDKGKIKIDTIENLLKNLTFNGNKNTIDLLQDLSNHQWLKIDYIVKYENDEFYNMSQGKKSFVILKMLLEFNKDNNPIIIDQPEDSLDNRAIYNDLTNYLKEKKKECQIIVVTHNANIVIGADSENVIVANQNSKKTSNANGEKFMYINGSIESNESNISKDDFLSKKTIREHIFEILEGGDEAFKKREDRYHM